MIRSNGATLLRTNYFWVPVMMNQMIFWWKKMITWHIKEPLNQLLGEDVVEVTTIEAIHQNRNLETFYLASRDLPIVECGVSVLIVQV
jgi:hypothetical protein